jgi:hypothetical protein
MTRYRVLVTGSRDWDDADAIREALEAIEGNVEPGDTLTLIHGTAQGADSLAAAAARRLGWTIEPHPADWRRLGRRAGFVRNAEMVASGADVCLAFIKNNSRGATMCAELARQAGIPVTTEERRTP